MSLLSPVITYISFLEKHWINSLFLIFFLGFMPLTESPTLEPDESSYLFRRYWTVNSLHYNNLVLSLFKLSNYKEIRNAERNLKKSINQLFRLTQKKIKHRNTLRLLIFSKIHISNCDKYYYSYFHDLSLISFSTIEFNYKYTF